MEVRLGAGESMANINLGATEIQEVYLGTVLVWRNNVLPFFALSINGTVVSSNGTPEEPLDQVEAADAVLSTFEYLDNISVTISNVNDEDMQYPVAFNLYKGDFDLDETLTPIGAQVNVTGVTPGLAGTWNAHEGKVTPTGPNAADYIETDQLYSLVGVDAEDGISIQYFRITSTDSTDVQVVTPFVNSGGLFGPVTNAVSTQVGLMQTFNTQCFDEESTTITFDRTTTQPQRSQNQVRTCSVTINGIADTPAVTCAGVSLAQTISANSGPSSFTDLTTGSVNVPNGNWITGATATNNVGGPGPASIASLVSSVTGTCSPGPLNGSACAAALVTCTQSDGSATVTTTTTPRTQDRNCAGGFIGGPILGTPVTSTSTSACSYNYANPAFVPPANISSAIFSISGNNSTNILYTYGANFSSALSDDGNVGALRRIIAGTVSWSNITAGTSSSFSVSITATEAGCAGSPGCGGMTSVSDPATNPMSPLPSAGDVVEFTLSVGPSTYNSGDGGNVAGSGTATATHTWS